MNIYVVTDDKGEIVATAQNDAGSGDDVTVLPPLPLPGQKVHHIELPKDLEGLRNPEQLHQRLKAHVKS